MWPNNVDKTQLEISYSRGSGNGGQKKQKTSSKCTMKHIPTGIQVTCEEYREQSRNKVRAFQKLAEKLVPLMKKALQIEKIKQETERIRTYKEKEDLVIDERVDCVFSYKDVMEGNGIEKVIKEVSECKCKNS